MARLLLIGAVVAVIYLLIKSYRKNTPPLQDEPGVEDMVRCAYCGMHLPKGESVRAGGNHFCDTGHRDAYRE